MAHKCETVSQQPTSEEKVTKEDVGTSCQDIVADAPPSYTDAMKNPRIIVAEINTKPERSDKRTAPLVLLSLLASILLICVLVFGLASVLFNRDRQMYQGACQFRLRLRDLDNANLLSDTARYRYKEFPALETSTESFNVPETHNEMMFLPINYQNVERQPDFTEQFAIDAVREMWATLTTPHIPDIRNGHAARFILDFNTNLTAIMDLENSECYLMELNRTAMQVPDDLMTFLYLMQKQEFPMSPEVIERNYLVDPFVVTDFSNVGPYITNQCAGMPTFWLVEKSSKHGQHLLFKRRIRRNAKEHKQQVTFIEFIPSSKTDGAVNALKLHFV